MKLTFAKRELKKAGAYIIEKRKYSEMYGLNNHKIELLLTDKNGKLGPVKVDTVNCIILDESEPKMCKDLPFIIKQIT